jgi:hypothetical protein
MKIDKIDMKVERLQEAGGSIQTGRLVLITEGSVPDMEHLKASLTEFILFELVSGGRS